MLGEEGPHMNKQGWEIGSNSVRLREVRQLADQKSPPPHFACTLLIFDVAANATVASNVTEMRRFPPKTGRIYREKNRRK